MSTATGDNALLHHLEVRPARPTHYGRMVPESDPPGCESGQLMRAGSRGGLCDANADSAFDDPTDANATDATEAAEAAGWPFFGQLIAHDITADHSPLTSSLAPDALRNARFPKLDVEML